jgi:hypothetical protein
MRAIALLFERQQTSHHHSHMDENGAEGSGDGAISYPTLTKWAEVYGLEVTPAVRTLDRCVRRVYQHRFTTLSDTTRYRCMDMQRFISVMDQIALLQEEDVMTFSLRCPTRMRRYLDALAHMIGVASKFAISEKDVDTMQRVHGLLTEITEEMTTFYSGLS